MRIIPVLDLKGGRAVRAVRGDRDAYAPIASRLVASSAPQDVVAAYLGLFDFSTFYVADLDAIEGRVGQSAMLLALTRDFPKLSFWVDDGSAEPGRIAALRGIGVEPVIGSESIPAGEAATALASGADAILSLDFRGGGVLGPPELQENAQLWPRRVIAMTLARVGSFEGPDLDLAARLARKAEGRSLYAAGGVRDAADLDALARTGVAGALVASALHDGRLSRADLRRFAAE
ncbi:HisA/HisF-related TIM barrel protein [Methylosinus sp. Sm6]|uniref:HisA/HisF-related TIM barrel protein n=1 Tax=Methylosinus sp. Sm6 TaxID=2866948 RepID=UPI001C99453C|nr:HisA/HisF-related TIM barrel protein [Methylosinus sp. Sm6]MBY6241705.1 histidine biosynthesis protein [Methylosinus sp. Sm6]